MSRRLGGLIVLIVIAVLCLIYIRRPVSSSYEISKIDSLELIISNINKHRDSLVQKLDTIYIEKILIEKKYEKNISTIINNSPSEDYEFFSNYIRRNRARLDSISRAN